MRHDTEDQTDRDADLDAILGAYFDAVAAGEEPDRLAWIAGHPKYSAELAAYFVEQDRLHHLTGPLRAAALPPLGCESRVLGGFVLLEELARGGMGVVYKARQVSLNRIVALKLILAGEFAGSADVQRFRAEAEAVAELDHPHIVPIYEVGSHQGRHFFSMKLFEGGSLADCLDRFVADLRAAVRLVASVARAVDHAHRRGILHRDLKPSNILLDEDGEPHVVDFGLARRVGGDGDLTRSGEVLGTPAYMAPEQASGRRGEVTTATDIYGLGAVLYALLTGRAPFACDPAADLLESVRTRPPAPPSSVNRRVDRDLQTICLKCLEKEPAHRYATAEELAEDLDRWLRGEPIAARPVGRTERAWRWARRNPTTAGLGGAVVLLAFAAIVGLAISNALISRERARAEDRSRTARRAVDTMFTRVAEEWLGQQAQLEPLQRDFLLEALSFYQQFAREEGRDPRVQLTTARAYGNVGRIQHKLGRDVEAEVAFRRAIAILEGLAKRDPANPTYPQSLASYSSSLGDALSGQNTGRPREAERAFRRALQLSEELVARYPGETDYREPLSGNLDRLAMLLLGEGRLPEAERDFRRAVEIQEQLVAQAPGEPRFRYGLAARYHGLGKLLFETGRVPEAERAFRRAIALGEEVVSRFPKVPSYRGTLVSMRNLLGFVLCTTGRLADAESVIRRTIELEEQLVAQSPEVPTYRQKLAMDCGNLGSVLMDTGRLAEAERLFRRAIEIDERLVAQSPGPTAYRGELASQWTNLGNVLQRTGRGPEAERAFRRAITLDEGLAAESAGPNPDLWSGLGADLMNLASLLVSRGELAEARHLVDRAILRQRAALALKPRQPQFHEYLGAQYRLLVNIALQSGDHAEAARAAEEVIRAVPERVRDVPSAAGVLAHCAQMARQDPNLLPEERAALAESYAGRAEALIRDAAGRVGADPDGLNDLAWLLATSPESRFRDPARAVELARKAVALTPKNGNSWNTLGVALYRAGDWNGSISALEQSMTLRGGGDATDWFFLAMARRRRHEEDRARSWYDKAVAWMEENQPNNEELRHFRAEAAALIGAVPSMPDGIEAFAHSDSPQSGSAAATARSQSLDNSHAVPSSTRPGSAASSSQDALSNTAGVGRRLDPTNP